MVPSGAATNVYGIMLCEQVLHNPIAFCKPIYNLDTEPEMVYSPLAAIHTALVADCRLLDHGDSCARTSAEDPATDMYRFSSILRLAARTYR